MSEKSMQSIIEQGPKLQEAYDANTSEAHAYYGTVKKWIDEQNKDINELDKSARLYGEEALAFRTMLKFIESEEVIRSLESPVLLTLINPVYKETGRMQSRSDHPHGENSLKTKLDVLRYFESLNPNFKGRVFVIDDECPDGSGDMAAGIISKYGEPAHHVYYLGTAIDESDPDLPPGITHKDGSNRSVKGGAVLYGMRKALDTQTDGLHIIVDNDADLSIHPMELGLLIKDIVNGDALAVAGSRREEDSVALIGAGRNTRGNLFIKIWQHLLPGLAENVIDTNRAFKAFEQGALETILPKIETYTFPYQIELLQASISNDIPLVKKGIAYLDSEAASTQNGENITETYLNQIHQIIDIAKRYKTIPKSDELLNFFANITEDDWRKIEANPPDDLTQLYKTA